MTKDEIMKAYKTEGMYTIKDVVDILALPAFGEKELENELTTLGIIEDGTLCAKFKQDSMGAVCNIEEFSSGQGKTTHQLVEFTDKGLKWIIRYFNAKRY